VRCYKRHVRGHALARMWGGQGLDGGLGIGAGIGGLKVRMGGVGVDVVGARYI